MNLKSTHICASAPRRPLVLRSSPPLQPHVTVSQRLSPELQGCSPKAGSLLEVVLEGQLGWRRGHQDQGFPGNLAQGRKPSGPFRQWESAGGMWWPGCTLRPQGEAGRDLQPGPGWLRRAHDVRLCPFVPGQPGCCGS